MHTATSPRRWSTDQYGNSVLVGSFSDSQRHIVKSAHDELTDYLREREMRAIMGTTRRHASSLCG
jgi:hypothetical protein